MLSAAGLDLFRWQVSFDFDDMATLLTALAALLGVVLIQRRYTRSEERSKALTTDQLVDAPVLKEFGDLYTKLGQVQQALVEARSEIDALRVRLEQAIRDEAAYQAELHEKDRKIEELRQKLIEANEDRDGLRDRVQHLEDVCKRAGINGEGRE